MKEIFSRFSLLVISILLINYSVFAQDSNLSKPFRHIVVITFKPDASVDSIEALDNLYKDLSKSAFVKDFEWGVNVSARDTTTLKHIYNTSFASKQDLERYRKIPEYRRLFQLSLPIADDVNVVDYTINK